MLAARYKLTVVVAPSDSALRSVHPSVDASSLAHRHGKRRYGYRSIARVRAAGGPSQAMYALRAVSLRALARG